MKAADVRAMTADQLDDELLKLKKEQFNLRFQRATGQLENTSRVREVRRDIARLKTIARCRSARRSRRLRRRQMPKRRLQGVVVSDKNDKTVVVRVERRFTHPVLKKTVRRSKKYPRPRRGERMLKVGDMVWIEERMPISKNKRWVVIRGEKRAKPKRRSRREARRTGRKSTHATEQGEREHRKECEAS